MCFKVYLVSKFLTLFSSRILRAAYLEHRIPRWCFGSAPTLRAKLSFDVFINTFSCERKREGFEGFEGFEGPVLLFLILFFSFFFQFCF